MPDQPEQPRLLFFLALGQTQRISYDIILHILICSLALQIHGSLPSPNPTIMLKSASEEGNWRSTGFLLCASFVCTKTEHSSKKVNESPVFSYVHWSYAPQLFCIGRMYITHILVVTGVLALELLFVHQSYSTGDFLCSIFSTMQFRILGVTFCYEL